MQCQTGISASRYSSATCQGEMGIILFLILPIVRFLKLLRYFAPCLGSLGSVWLNGKVHGEALERYSDSSMTLNILNISLTH